VSNRKQVVGNSKEGRLISNESASVDTDDDLTEHPFPHVHPSKFAKLTSDLVKSMSS
jgi:hypothetical protein